MRENVRSKAYPLTTESHCRSLQEQYIAAAKQATCLNATRAHWEVSEPWLLRRAQNCGGIFLRMGCWNYSWGFLLLYGLRLVG